MASHKTPKLFLRYEGVFDFENLYAYIREFFNNKQYDYIEKGWKEKDATPQGREITVKMIPEKNVTEYIKYAWSVEWKSVDAHPVTVEEGGKSKKKTHARFHLHIQAELIEDWQGLGDKHSGLADFFSKYVFKRERDNEYMSALEQEAQELLDGVQQQLGMQTTKEH